MANITRFGISLEKDLLKKFDSSLKEKTYQNRSEAIRDLIRESLIKKEWLESRNVAGAIILVYDHHKRELVDRILDIQHNYSKHIISSQHVHLDHNNCLEMIAVKGNAKDLVNLANKLKVIRGVKHGELAMTTTGKKIV